MTDVSAQNPSVTSEAAGSTYVRLRSLRKDFGVSGAPWGESVRGSAVDVVSVMPPDSRFCAAWKDGGQSGGLCRARKASIDVNNVIRSASREK